MTYTPRRFHLVASAGAVLLTACLSSDKRGIPLYPASDSPRPREAVAELRGYVARVDDAEVAERGRSFELLPGCHIIDTPTSWGQVSAESGGWVVKTGRITFAVPMKAGNQYLIDLHLSTMGSGGSASISAIEKDAAGNELHSWPPARSNEDIRACQREANL